MKIVTTPNEILIKTAKEVEKIDKKILTLIAEMKQVLISQDNPKGVGLAAPQVGVNLRIFLLRPEEGDPIRVIINPKILTTSKKIVSGIPGTDNHIEGCLSIPHVWGVVKRHESLTLEFQDEVGTKKTEIFKDFPSVIVQHEVDHLNGILFTKRVIEQKGQLYKPTTNEKGEEVLEPIEL